MIVGPIMTGLIEATAGNTYFIQVEEDRVDSLVLLGQNVTPGTRKHQKK